MSAPDELLETIRQSLEGFGDVREQKMFGGVGFMLDGNLVVAETNRGLLFRADRNHAGRHDRTLSVRPFSPMEPARRVVLPGCSLGSRGTRRCGSAHVSLVRGMIAHIAAVAARLKHQT